MNWSGMKKLFPLIAMATVMLPTFAFSIDKDVDIELRRLEQRMMRIYDTNQELVQQIRVLERDNASLKKVVDDFMVKYDVLNDQVTKLQNVDINNLRAGQKGLYDQIPLFTWGEDIEDCKDIETKHQQINSIKSADGTQTMRFLCFDGKAIHLGTEYHGVPK